MERLTKRKPLAGNNVAYVSDEDCFDVWSVPKTFMGNAIDRLASIEDILGEDYDLDRLSELVEADKDGRCVVFQPGPSVMSHYYDEDGLYIREAVGTVKKEEYEAALGETLSSVSEEARKLYYDILTGKELRGEKQ